MGMGWRRGWAGWGYAPAAYPAWDNYAPVAGAQDEAGALKQQVAYYTEALESIKKRLAELSEQTRDKK